MIKNQFLQLLEENPKWWKVKSGRKEGFASKHYFVHREAKKEYERKPWYFGDMTREDAERLLGDTANPDGFGKFKLVLFIYLQHMLLFVLLIFVTQNPFM